MKIRKKRPKLADAHNFYKRGYYQVAATDYLSKTERVGEAEKIREALYHISCKGIPRTQNLEYMVLKCHLITEFALTQYIRFFSTPVIDVKDIHLTYAQKLDVAYILGFGATDPCLIPTLEMLNKARNQVAHTFVLETAIIDELLRINSEDYDDFKTPSLQERIRGLRQITQFICGITSGLIEARAHLEA